MQHLLILINRRSLLRHGQYDQGHGETKNDIGAQRNTSLLPHPDKVLQHMQQLHRNRHVLLPCPETERVRRADNAPHITHLLAACSARRHGRGSAPCAVPAPSARKNCTPAPGWTPDGAGRHCGFPCFFLFPLGCLLSHVLCLSLSGGIRTAPPEDRTNASP